MPEWIFGFWMSSKQFCYLVKSQVQAEIQCNGCFRTCKFTGTVKSHILVSSARGPYRLPSQLVKCAPALTQCLFIAFQHYSLFLRSIWIILQLQRSQASYITTSTSTTSWSPKSATASNITHGPNSTEEIWRLVATTLRIAIVVLFTLSRSELSKLLYLGKTSK